MLPQEIIRTKRDGGRLDDDDIDAFVAGITDGSVAEGQAAAFAMAVYFQGMDVSESVALTRAMQRSGTTLRWALDGPVVDKHSTGGVGDTVSLMLAPMVAACGGYVPMISGRGLGHTGGTYDKFESIPGYRAAPDLAEFQRVVAEVGCAVIGQTPELAPADKRLYGIRDVTATVESIPLITASILSKKLAAGLDALAMDVKFGNGAFMREMEQANDLARSIVGVAEGAGVRTAALLTDMDQPLADTAGNTLEVAYAIEYLTGAHANRESTRSRWRSAQRCWCSVDWRSTMRRRGWRSKQRSTPGGQRSGLRQWWRRSEGRAISSSNRGPTSSGHRSRSRSRSPTRESCNRSTHARSVWRSWCSAVGAPGRRIRWTTP